MIDAIVFDFDGVIVDTEPLHWRAFLEVVGPMGVEFSYETYRQRYIGYDDRDGFRAMAKDFQLPMSDDDLAVWIDRKADALDVIIDRGVQALPGAVELIEQAAARVPLAICSGALRRDIDAILPRVAADLSSRFSAIISADDVARSKPDPLCYLLAAERLNIAPTKCLAIEDTPAGIASARAAGMKVLGVATTFDRGRLGEAHQAVDCLSAVSLDGLLNFA